MWCIISIELYYAPIFYSWIYMHNYTYMHSIATANFLIYQFTTTSTNSVNYINYLFIYISGVYCNLHCIHQTTLQLRTPHAQYTQTKQHITVLCWQWPALQCVTYIIIIICMCMRIWLEVRLAFYA